MRVLLQCALILIMYLPVGRTDLRISTDVIMDFRQRTDNIKEMIQKVFKAMNTTVVQERHKKTGCPADYFEVARFNSCYKFVASESDWFGANNQCTSEGATLLTLETPEEDEYIRLHMMTNAALRKLRFFTAATDLGREGVYKWHPSGQLISFSPSWGPGNPNGKGENCLYLMYDSTHQRIFWYDYSCGNSCGWICEKTNEL